MTDAKQEGQKTIVSFIVGLLIGGLLVWAFSGPDAAAPKDEPKEDKKTEEVKESAPEQAKTETTTSEATPSLPVGDGKVSVNDQAAGTTIALASVTFPIAEGWIGVRDYSNGRLGSILGVARFSEAQGLVPTNIPLQRATTAGREYAVVVFSDDGDRSFNLASDAQIDSVFATFNAQ